MILVEPCIYLNIFFKIELCHILYYFSLKLIFDITSLYLLNINL